MIHLEDNFVADDFRAQRPDAQILLTPVSDPRASGVAELGPRAT